MMERIIWCAGPVNDRMSTIVQAQLMFLDSIGNVWRSASVFVDDRLIESALARSLVFSCCTRRAICMEPPFSSSPASWTLSQNTS